MDSDDTKEVGIRRTVAFRENLASSCYLESLVSLVTSVSLASFVTLVSSAAYPNPSARSTVPACRRAVLRRSRL